ncbi:hypothetical protein B0H13DRAFT_1926072 [Mycena leptocephala]|nr:hypothetical protein B0H13DRAFT_1926072 [Mycena leptocephala]
MQELWLPVTNIPALKNVVSVPADLSPRNLAQKAEPTTWNTLPLCAIAEAHKKEAEGLLPKYLQLCPDNLKKDNPEYDHSIPLDSESHFPIFDSGLHPKWTFLFLSLITATIVPFFVLLEGFQRQGRVTGICDTSMARAGNPTKNMSRSSYCLRFNKSFLNLKSLKPLQLDMYNIEILPFSNAMNMLSVQVDKQLRSIQRSSHWPGLVKVTNKWGIFFCHKVEPVTQLPVQGRHQHRMKHQEPRGGGFKLCGMAVEPSRYSTPQ